MAPADKMVRMYGNEQSALTPKEGCEECRQLKEWVESTRKAKSYLIYGPGSGYESNKSHSRQPKQIRNQMDNNNNAERLAQAKLRMHEIKAHEGLTNANFMEYKRQLDIAIRDGRDHA